MEDHFINTDIEHNLDWILSPNVAAGYAPETFTREEPYFPCGVTGQRYFPHEWTSASTCPAWVQLDPMPDNVYDACALRVIHRNQQIGWVPAEHAHRLAPYVYLLKANGSKCKVPLTKPKVERLWDPVADQPKLSVQIGVMLLPTSDYREALFPPAKLFRQFDLIWKLLTDAERDEIRQNRYYLDDDIPEVLERFTALGRENTNYPFVLPAESDSIIAEYLTWYRRMIDKYSAMRDKALRNLHIVTEATAGRSYRSIADETALTPSTVGDINRKGRNQEQYKAWQSLADEIPGDEPSLTNYVLQEHF